MFTSDYWLAGLLDTHRLPIFCYLYLSPSQFMSVIFVRFRFHLVASWLNFVFLALTPWISDARCLPICVVVAGSTGEWHLFYLFVVGVIYFTFVNRTVILLYLFLFFLCCLFYNWCILFVLFHPPTSRSNSICGWTDVWMNRHLSPYLVAIGWLYACMDVMVSHMCFSAYFLK